jgi:hypothetical protein
MMSHADGHERLIQDLATDLRPVQRLRPPGRRALAWLAAAGAAAAGLAAISDLGSVRDRLVAVPDMWFALAGSVLTAVLAAVAAFQLGLPDRRPAWALLPLPAATLWLAASGLGCLRSWTLPGVHPASPSDTMDCLAFILGLSAPLSALLVLMLRRAATLQPGLTAAMAGLASAAAAAALLTIVHPFDASAVDLAVHVGAVLAVVAANRAWGGRLLGDGGRPRQGTA